MGWEAGEVSYERRNRRLIPVRAAHTGGDTMIRFENANAIMIGDFYRNYGYPYIDTNNGGSLKGALEALDATMKLAGPDTKTHSRPRHHHQPDGPHPLPRHDPRRTGKVQQMIAEGKTQQEVLAAKVTAPYMQEFLVDSCRLARDERRPVCRDGVFGIEGQQVSPRSSFPAPCLVPRARLTRPRRAGAPHARKALKVHTTD